MAKVYLLTQSDLDLLLTMVDRDPKHGAKGGSSDAPVRGPVENAAHDKAHRFYNYQVRSWLDKVQKDQ
jgi:hypothetical protein